MVNNIGAIPTRARDNSMESRVNIHLLSQDPKQLFTPQLDPLLTLLNCYRWIKLDTNKYTHDVYIKLDGKVYRPDRHIDATIENEPIRIYFWDGRQEWIEKSDLNISKAYFKILRDQPNSEFAGLKARLLDYATSLSFANNFESSRPEDTRRYFEILGSGQITHIHALYPGPYLEALDPTRSVRSIFSVGMDYSLYQFIKARQIESLWVTGVPNEVAMGVCGIVNRIGQKYKLKNLTCFDDSLPHLLKVFDARSIVNLRLNGVISRETVKEVLKMKGLRALSVWDMEDWADLELIGKKLKLEELYLGTGEESLIEKLTSLVKVSFPHLKKLGIDHVTRTLKREFLPENVETLAVAASQAYYDEKISLGDHSAIHSIPTVELSSWYPYTHSVYLPSERMELDGSRLGLTIHCNEVLSHNGYLASLSHVNGKYTPKIYSTIMPKPKAKGAHKVVR